MLQETALRVVDGLMEVPEMLELQQRGEGDPRADDPLKMQHCDAVLQLTRFATWDQPKLLEAAVDLLDSIKSNETSIRCYVSSGAAGTPQAKVRRKCWRVPGTEKGTEYACLLHYCPCDAYVTLAAGVSEGRTAMCKHLLAIRIATALSQTSHVALAEEQFVNKMLENSAVGVSRSLRW